MENNNAPVEIVDVKKEKSRVASQAWRDNNRDHIKEYNKKKYADNREAFLAKYSVYQDCGCGGHYNLLNRSKHFKTKNHIKFAQEQIVVEVV